MNESISVSEGVRLALYIAMAMLPIWIDFFTKSTDYTLRGLMMPILSSINAAVIVTLAKTSLRKPASPAQVEVTNTPVNPVNVIEPNK